VFECGRFFGTILTVLSYVFLLYLGRYSGYMWDLCWKYFGDQQAQRHLISRDYLIAYTPWYYYGLLCNSCGIAVGLLWDCCGIVVVGLL
jgi:hypothetical protein